MSCLLCPLCAHCDFKRFCGLWAQNALCGFLRCNVQAKLWAGATRVQGARGRCAAFHQGITGARARGDAGRTQYAGLGRMLHIPKTSHTVAKPVLESPERACWDTQYARAPTLARGSGSISEESFCEGEPTQEHHEKV